MADDALKDGTVMSAEPKEMDDEHEAATEEEQTGRGPLLDEQDEKKVVKAILNNWKHQDEVLSYELCEVKQAEFWRSGERFVFIRKAGGDQGYDIWRPPGVDRLPSLPDKVDELVRRVVAQLLVDPPKLEGVPTTGEEQDEQAAELATRLFQVEGAESGVNLRMLLEGAIDISLTQKSAFAHVLVDPQGGGEQPVTVMAHPKALIYDENDPALCTIDPDTKKPSGDLVTKYLAQDGVTLEESESENTKRRWVPGLKVDILGMRNVRFLPHWSRNLDDADGVIVADYVSVGFLKRLYPDTVGQMDNAKLKKLVSWQGLDVDELLPQHAKNPTEIGTWMDDQVPDDAIALVVWEYHRQSPIYPKGAYVCIGGDGILGRDTLEADVETPDGRELDEVLDVPVSQNRCLNDWVGLSPYGIALVTKLGPWNDLMAQQWTAVMDWLDRWNHPLQFIPLGSVVQPGQLAARNGEPVYVNPDGTPITEPVAPIPADVKEWYDRSVDGMNNASGLQEAAQGVDSPNTASGVSKQIVIEQALVSLSAIKQNAEDFMTRLGRLLLQRWRTAMTVPQTIQYVGDDASYRVDEWSRANLFGTKDVRIARGSFTLLNPQYKQQRVMELAAGPIPMISPDQAKDMLTSSVSAQVGLEDNPVRLRIKRQIDALLTKGAPFEPLPVDEVPEIAKDRFRELAKAMMTTKFSKLDDQLKQAFVAEYDRMRQAAGIVTVAEQAQQAQAQQAQVAQVEMQKQQTQAQTDIQKEQVKSALDVQEKEAEARIDVGREAALAAQFPAQPPIYAA